VAGELRDPANFECPESALDSWNLRQILCCHSDPQSLVDFGEFCFSFQQVGLLQSVYVFVHSVHFDLFFVHFLV